MLRKRSFKLSCDERDTNNVEAHGDNMIDEQIKTIITQQYIPTDHGEVEIGEDGKNKLVTNIKCLGKKIL